MGGLMICLLFLKLFKRLISWMSRAGGWLSLNRIGRRMRPFAIHSLPESQVSLLSQRCSGVHPSTMADLFVLNAISFPTHLRLYPPPTDGACISPVVPNMHKLLTYSFLLAARQVSSTGADNSISNYPLRKEREEKERLTRSTDTAVMFSSFLYFY